MTRTTTSSSCSTYYTLGHCVVQRLDGLYSYIWLSSFYKMTRLWTVTTGVWWQASRSATTDQAFSVGDRSGKVAGHGSSRTFPVSRKARTIMSTCGCALSCWNVAFHRARIKGRAIGLNPTEMQRQLFKVLFVRTRDNLDVYTMAPHTTTLGDGAAWRCRVFVEYCFLNIVSFAYFSTCVEMLFIYISHYTEKILPLLYKFSLVALEKIVPYHPYKF